jgi:hypothetical protein
MQSAKDMTPFMMLRTTFVGCATLYAALHSGLVHADRQFFDGSLRISGFGTIGINHARVDEVTPSSPGYATPSDQSSLQYRRDTKLAVQARYSATPTLKAVTQVMVKSTPNGKYEPVVEWAFAKWSPAPTLSFRIGRVGAPLFLVSDSREVGYTSLQVRPPIDVYGQVPVTYMDGADVSYQFDLGGMAMTTTLFGGSASSDYASYRSVVSGTLISEFKLRNALGGYITLASPSGWTARLGHAHGKISVSSTATEQLLLLAPPGPVRDLAVGALVVEDESASFTSLGLTYERSPWTFSAEYTLRKAAGLVPDTAGWYVMGGYRFGNLTPFVGMSRQTLKRAESNPLAAFVGTPGPTGFIAGTVDNVLTSLRTEQRTTTLGLRWDIAPDLALKGQVESILKPANSYGSFFRSRADTPEDRAFYEEERRINVFSLSMDFVF